MLGIKPVSFGGAARALNREAISLAPEMTCEESKCPRGTEGRQEGQQDRYLVLLSVCSSGAWAGLLSPGAATAA